MKKYWFFRRGRGLFQEQEGRLALEVREQLECIKSSVWMEDDLMEMLHAGIKKRTDKGDVRGAVYYRPPDYKEQTDQAP